MYDISFKRNPEYRPVQLQGVLSFGITEQQVITDKQFSVFSNRRIAIWFKFDIILLTVW